MCGIVGLVKRQAFNEEDLSNLRGMTGSLLHRGPDFQDVVVSSDDYCGLGHARLSIIDLSSSGQQPMISDCGRYVLVFNGEIYNYRTLKLKLNEFDFRGSSDTEVLFYCLIKFGISETLKLLNGMFAFAFYDVSKGLLSIARDRFGEKPLYYCINEKGSGEMYFGSELKSLNVTLSGLKVSKSGIESFLALGYIPSPQTIYENVKKLPPGKLLEYSVINGTVSLTNFFDARKGVEVNLSSIGSSKETRVKDLRSLLETVVQEQMISDVPVGSFLSGGIDSTLVTAIMKRNSGASIETFTIGYEDKRYSEHLDAAEIARFLGTKHNELIVDASMVTNLVERVINIYDEPFSDPSLLPTLLVSEFASKKVKVVLSGDGGDEIFGGYNRYLFAEKYWSTISKWPFFTRRLAGELMGRIPERFVNQLEPFIAVRSLSHKWQTMSGVFSSRSLGELYFSLLLKHGVNEKLSEVDLARIFSGQISIREINSFRDMMQFDQVTYLPDNIFTKVDRASMLYSLETRAPFVDYRIYQFMENLKNEDFIFKGKTKILLREVLKTYVPESLTDRPKMGFGLPIDKWMRKELKEWCLSLLESDLDIVSEFIPRSRVHKMWDEHQSDKFNWAFRLWPIFILMQWSKTNKIH